MESKRLTSNLNGSLHKGNYVWGGAMNLAWNELVTGLNKGPLDLAVKDETAQKMVDNFNHTPFSTNDLSSDSYYVKSGYGQQTVKAINTECKKKFPKKSFADLNLQLAPQDIISYAYFMKEVQYLTPFAKHQNFHFKQGQNYTKVKGFKAKTHQHFKNIELLDYKSDKQFVVRLKLKEPKEQLYLIKGSQDKLPQDIAKMANGNNSLFGQLDKSDDEFEMPVVQLEVDRSYDELVGSGVKSGNLKGYAVGAMFEKIKFKIDEVGAKVQNQAVMMMHCCAKMSQPKRLIFNEPFWVIMKQKGCHPYFIAQITNTNFMHAEK